MRSLSQYLLVHLYDWDMGQLAEIALVLFIIWSCLNLAANRRSTVRTLLRAFSALLALLFLAGILSFCVFNRTRSDVHQFVWLNWNGRDLWRELFMNLLLYYPFGLTLTVLIGPTSIAVSLVLSCSIEIWQYYAGTGVAQGTDVIMNCLGCVIGALPWLLARRLRKQKHGE